MEQTNYNHKHLILSQRIEIEKGLNEGQSCAEIARRIGKHRSTVAKEIQRHRAHRVSNRELPMPPCLRRNNCQVRYLCSRQCGIMCKICRRQNTICYTHCEQYKPAICEKVDKYPYVCNGCTKRVNCTLNKKVYGAKYADDTYRELLSSSREGVNQTPESIKELDDLISPLIRKGQSIAHIYTTHSHSWFIFLWA